MVILREKVDKPIVIKVPGAGPHPSSSALRTSVAASTGRPSSAPTAAPNRFVSGANMAGAA